MLSHKIPILEVPIQMNQKVSMRFKAWRDMYERDFLKCALQHNKNVLSHLIPPDGVVIPTMKAVEILSAYHNDSEIKDLVFENGLNYIFILVNKNHPVSQDGTCEDPWMIQVNPSKFEEYFETQT